MSDEHAEGDALAQRLAALASPTRLALLRALRAQSRLTDIDVRVPEPDGRLRRLTRQTIRFHLDELARAGLVVARGTERDGQPATEFHLNHQRIFALSEEVRALARLRPLLEPVEETHPRAHAQGPRRAGPLLLLVRGLEDGATFDLRPERAGQEWVVGRARACEVPLDFDPAVSQANARVAWDGARHALEDVPGSRNGTRHNLRLLAPGERVPLQHGDLVGVGHCALLYWR